MARPIRPGWLTAVAVLSVVLGSLGLLSAAVGVLGQLYGAQVQQWIQDLVAAQLKTSGIPNEALELQQELQQLIIEVQTRWRTTMLVLAGMNAIASMLLIAGGIGTLKVAPWGRTLLIAALAATMAYEIALAVPTLLIQRESQEVTEQYTAKIINAQVKARQGTAPAALPPNVAVFTNIGMVIGVVMTLGWLLVKLALYGAAIAYLHRPLIRSLFANERGAVEVQAIEP